MYDKRSDRGAADARAERESNPSRIALRAAKRGLMQANYRNNGLNGPRAVARRRRQIAAGQITAANGLEA